MADTLDFNALTLGDIEEIEDYTGQTLAQIVAEAQRMDATSLPRGRLLTALAWVAKRQSNPNITIQQVRAMPLSEVVGEFASLGNAGAGVAAAGDDSAGSRPSAASTPS